MDTSVTYHKDEKVEELNNEIADIFSEAIYSYIIRKGLLKRKVRTGIEPVKRIFEK